MKEDIHTQFQINDIREQMFYDCVRERTADEKKKEKAYINAFRKFSKSGWLPYLVDLEKMSRGTIILLAEKPTDSVREYIYQKYCENNFRACKRLKKRLDGYFQGGNDYYRSFNVLYRKKEFLGCCMMLFALIEQRIRQHYCTNTQPENLVPRALDDIFNDINFKFGIYSMHPSRVLCQKSLVNLLRNYFENAKNFINEPEYMNRNFLMHGMAKREYSHIDCIQLMCILDYFCHFEMEAKKANEEKL